MKKLYFVFALAAAVVSCQKIETVSNGSDFEVFATVEDTRTANDGLSTKWVSGDAFNVFHAAAGSTTYVSDGSFAISNATTGNATGKLSGTLDASASYDWYAFYPYSQYIKTPANTSSGYVTVGGVSQTQNGNDSMAHLCGDSCPLYGIVKSVAGSQKPTIAMKQICSVVEITVTNVSSSPLSVSAVSFTGTEDIAGTYYVNFVSNPMGFVASGASYVSNTATLGVLGGAALATNASAKFYVAVKPFTAAAGSTIKVAVNGYEKSISLSKATTFAAGKIKKVNVDYDYEAGEKVYYEKVGSNLVDWSGKYLLVADQAKKAFSGFSTTSTVYGLGADVSIADKKIESTLANDAYQVEIAKSSVSGKYVIKFGTSYFNWASSSGNSLNGAALESNNSRWSISCKSGAVTLTNVADASRVIWWNNGSPRFACYTGKTAGTTYFALSLYRLGGGGTPAEEPATYKVNLPSSVTGGTLSADKKEAEAGETVKITANPASGYELDSMTASVTGETLSGNVLTFTMPAKDVTVTASFKVSSPVTPGGHDYELVSSALTDWRGDYLIAYSATVFMDGSLEGGTAGVGKAQSHVSPGTSLSGTTVAQSWGDQHYVTIEAIDEDDLSKGYVIKSHSSTTPYFYQTQNKNGMVSTSNKGTAAAYPITINFVSSSDVQLKLGGGAVGAILHYNNNSGSTGEMFRYYKDGGQSPVYLYKKQ